MRLLLSTFSLARLIQELFLIIYIISVYIPTLTLYYILNDKSFKPMKTSKVFGMYSPLNALSIFLIGGVLVVLFLIISDLL